MNKTHRLVWSAARHAYIVAHEKAAFGGRAGATLTLSLSLLIGLPAHATPGVSELPSGGSVVAGAASISTSGSRMDVLQTTQRAAIDWQTFNIGSAAHVHFEQPSGGVVLNRVLDTNASQIYGRLTATGQVFLVNPNGVFFAPGAQVDVGGIVASTLKISNADFMDGNYHFAGTSSNAIINQGNVKVGVGGTAAMIAARIENTGRIEAPQGNVLMGAGSKVTLDLGGPVKVRVDTGAVNALIEQGGAIKADGGTIYLAARTSGDLVSTVINHTGISEAQTITSGQRGKIYLMGDMQNGHINVAGTLDASAPNGADGGFIETSAARVNIQDGIRITTAAPQGKTGEWLIDPVDITIAASGGNVTGATLATALEATNITLDTNTGTATGFVWGADPTGTSGDIFVKDNINVGGGSASTTLTLKANRNIFIDAGKNISRTGGHALNTVLWADSDATGGGAIWIGKGNTFGSSSDTTISTNGGHITLSGGTDIATGYAEGVNGVNGNGVTLDRAQLLSGGGNIVIRGRSSTTSTSIASTDAASSGNTDGIRLHGGNTIDAGSGTINLTGVAQGTSGSSNGIETNFVGYTKILSSSTNTNAIALHGDATAGTSSNGWGTFLWGTNTSGIVLAATGAGGGVSLDGLGRSVSGGGGTHLEPNAFVLAASGPIDIKGTKGGASTYEGIVINSTVGFVTSLPGGFGISSPVTASASNISLTSDTLSANRVFDGGAFTGSAVQSTGTLTIAPRTSGKTLSVQTANPGGAGVWINPSSMFGASGLFKTGFSKLVFGSSTTGDVTLNNYSFDNDTELNTSGNAVLGSVAIANKALTVNMTGSGTITNTGAVAVSKLALNGSTSAATLTNTGNAIGTLAANVASLALVNASALTVGTVGATSGIVASGKIDIATLSGDLTLNGNLSAGSTATDAIVLNAGKNTAAGTSTGGNLIHQSGTLTTGTGGRVTLHTGSVAGSTGLTALVGSGSGRFRYHSDEAATNYTTALGSGLHAIYRERPTLTVTADDASITPAQAPYNGGNGVSYSGFVNGDTNVAALSGTPAYSGNSQGATSAGAYVITPSGLNSLLGYQLVYADGALTITSAPPAASSSSSTSSNTAAQNSAVSTAQSTVQQPVVNTSTTTNHAAPITPPPTVVFSQQGTLPVSDVSGGLAFVQVAAQPGQGSSTGLIQNNIRNVADLPADVGGRDPQGFMRVFVIDGGLSLPEVALAALGQPSRNDARPTP